MTGRLIVLGLVAVFAAASWVFSCEADRLQDLSQRVGILEPRVFEQLTVLTAGTGAAQEDPGKLGPAIVVASGDRVLLVDAGRAAPEALRKAKLPLTQLESVLLTSLLPENVAGLAELLATSAATGRTHPIRLLGPPGTKALAEGLAAALAPSLALVGTPPQAASFDVTELQEGPAGEAGGITIRAAALPGGPFPALAWRFDAGGRAAVVSGVGFGSDALVALSKGADLLVYEAMHTPTVEGAVAAGGEDGERVAREAALHAGAAAAGDVAARAGVGKLVLVRLRPPPLHDRQYTGLVRETFQGHVLVAEDGDEITR